MANRNKVTFPFVVSLILRLTIQTRPETTTPGCPPTASEQPGIARHNRSCPEMDRQSAERRIPTSSPSEPTDPTEDGIPTFLYPHSSRQTLPGDGTTAPLSYQHRQTTDKMHLTTGGSKPEPFSFKSMDSAGSNSHSERVHSDYNQSCQVLTKSEDVIIWKQDLNERQAEQYSWCITAPEEHGIVLQFYKVEMKDGDFLEIFSEFNRTSAWRNFSQVQEEWSGFYNPQMSLAPLLVKARSVIVRARVIINESRRYLSRFNLTYTVYLNRLIPVGSPVLSEKLTESDVMYDCSRKWQLPKAILCDGIRHCENGEDEANCTFAQPGCGDWMPYRDQCFKVVFARVLRYRPGIPHITMPEQAEQSCRRLFGATLASLPDHAGISVVTAMVLHSGFNNAVVGIRKVMPVSRTLTHLYRFVWQWGGQGSPMAYEQVSLQRTGVGYDCAVLMVLPLPFLRPVRCNLPFPPPHGFVCMRPHRVQRPVSPLPPTAIHLQRTSVVPQLFPTKECPEDRSLVQLFHPCHWGWQEKEKDLDWSPSNLPLFQCQSGDVTHYSLLCDGKGDCDDDSDETGCQRPQHSQLLQSSFICTNAQAVPADRRCDGKADCFDESDEEMCVSCGTNVRCGTFGCIPQAYGEYFHESCPWLPQFPSDPYTVSDPGAVLLDGQGMSRLRSANACMETFYPCHQSFCIPTFLLNNGEQDCPHGEDEIVSANSITCPGYYRCHGTGSCVHNDHLCDGIYHCPKKDDENFCGIDCPSERGCTCEGQAYTCSEMIDPRHHLHVRYLDVSHVVGVSLVHIHLMEYLFFLNLSFCHLSNVTLANMPQLRSLDLSFNLFFELSDIGLHNLSALTFLDLSNNPFAETMSAALSKMLKLGNFPNLMTLIIVNISLGSLEDSAFSSVSKLKTLDLRSNPLVIYTKESLAELTSMTVMYTDQPKLCCSYFHKYLSRCHAPADELSSCNDLLAQNVFRGSLWAIALLAIAGNGGVLFYRFCVSTTCSSFGVFVNNLCFSDLLMGVYMAMIGTADIQYRGHYVAKETEWRQSPACLIAGFLSFVSSEVSMMLIFLITLDRALVICFPLKPGLHLSRRATLCVCCAVWVLCLGLAAVPLALTENFYGQSNICLALPITRRPFPGLIYAFAVFIEFNLVLLLLVGAGQLLIYRAMRRASVAAGGSQRRGLQSTVKRRLCLVVFTDFCCWFPIAVIGLLVNSGVPVPDIVNVWVAIFVLPVNSALNPFLYTLDQLRHRRNGQGKRSSRAELARQTTQESMPPGHGQTDLWMTAIGRVPRLTTE